MSFFLSCLHTADHSVVFWPRLLLEASAGRGFYVHISRSQGLPRVFRFASVSKRSTRSTEMMLVRLSERTLFYANFVLRQGAVIDNRLKMRHSVPQWLLG